MIVCVAYKLSKCVKLDTLAGKEPESPLECTWNSTKFVKRPMSSGINPSKLLLKSRLCILLTTVSSNIYYSRTLNRDSGGWLLTQELNR